MTGTAIVVGGGLAGLTAAWRLRREGWRVDLLEATDRCGGVARSVREQGYLAEAGPNSMATTDPRILDLIDELGLSGELVAPAPEGRRRYVVRDGRPVALPSCPRTFLGSPLLSARTKARVVLEPFRPRRPAPARESVEEFFLRRGFGREFVERVVNPFVGGVFAADPARLSMRHALPRLHALEAESGSVLRGVVRAMRARRGEARSSNGAASGPPFFSFVGGMGRLGDALTERLGESIRTGVTVQAIGPDGSGWEVRSGSGRMCADAVVVAVPAHVATGMDLGGVAGDPGAALRRVRYAPMAVHVLGYARADVAHPLDGFGLLAPAEEARDILGVLFTSTLFPGRAPAGHVLLTTFVGGARDPLKAAAPPERREASVRAELADLLGVDGEPTYRRRVQWSEAIPQYGLDHGAILSRIAEVEAANQGLLFAGSWRAGVSVAHTMASGWDAAGRVLDPSTATREAA